MVHYGLPSSGKHAPCPRIENELLSNAMHSSRQMASMMNKHITSCRHPSVRVRSGGLTLAYTWPVSAHNGLKKHLYFMTRLDQ